MMESSQVIWEVKKNSIIKSIQEGKRIDGRKFDDYREFALREGIISKAEGSCWVKLGKTQVLVGIKMDVGEPYPDSQDEGVLVTNAELVPIASSEYQSGPPGEDAIELARVVDRGIRESKAIDFKKLCVREGELVWTVLVDVHVLDYDGNLIDAATLATMKALKGAYIPEIDAEDNIIREKTDKKMPINFIPVACTFAKIGGKNVIDPLLDEEKAMEARLTISTTDKGNICALQKSKGGSYTIEEINELAKIAVEKGKKIRKMM